VTDRPGASPPADDLDEAERAEVKATVEAWTASLGRDWDRWISYYHPDAVLLAPDRPRIRGRDEIAEFMRTAFAGVERMSHTNWTIDGSGDLAVVDNDANWMNAGSAAESTAKQIVVLRRHDPGRWLVHRVCFNSPGG
jgi:ketosteroid isomerase-like protein